MYLLWYPTVLVPQNWVKRNSFIINLIWDFHFNWSSDLSSQKNRLNNVYLLGSSSFQDPEKLLFGFYTFFKRGVSDTV